jgi:hypothetical protein
MLTMDVKDKQIDFLNRTIKELQAALQVGFESERELHRTINGLRAELQRLKDIPERAKA